MSERAIDEKYRFDESGIDERSQGFSGGGIDEKIINSLEAALMRKSKIIL